MTEHKKHLYYMNELSDYKISDGFPDVRGWDVKDIDNRVIGKVDNLLVNKDAERVVYLDVEVDTSIIDAKHDPYSRSTHGEVREFVNKDGESHIIVPIGLVDLNEDSNYVYTDIIDHRTFAETKRYRKGDIVNRDYEVQVLDSYGRKTRSQRYDTSDTAYQNRDVDVVDANRDRDLIDDDTARNNIVDEDRNINRRVDNDTYKKLPNEGRIREIVREEIRRYHEKNDAYSNRLNDDIDKTRYNDDVDDAVDDAVILTDEELELERRRRNDDVYDDDRFYERREFNDSRFRKRTPGL